MYADNPHKLNGENMAKYLPFRGNHSIVEAQANLLFPGQFDRQAVVAALGVAQAELRVDLPRSAEVRGGSMQIDISNPEAPSPIGTMSSDLVGFQLSNVQSNGQPARVVQLSGSILSVSIMDYQAWLDSRQTVERYMRPVLSSLALGQNPIIAFGLRFIDRFTFNGVPEEAQAGLLIAENSAHIAPQVFEVGASWHCNTGWFDFRAGDRILHNLNIASNIVDFSSAVTIDHQATMHVGTVRQSMDTLFSPPGDATGFMEALDMLHDQNKEILKKVLKPEMLAEIGLE